MNTNHQKYPTKFVVNALDIRSGKQVLLGSQETPDIRVEDALCATAAIPGLYAPVHVNDMVLVDGGAWDSILISSVPKEDLPVTLAIAPTSVNETSSPSDLISILRASFATLAMRGLAQVMEDDRYKDHIIQIPTPVSSMMMLSPEANSSSFRETLDFIGYTEVSRNAIVSR